LLLNALISGTCCHLFITVRSCP